MYARLGGTLAIAGSMAGSIASAAGDSGVPEPSRAIHFRDEATSVSLDLDPGDAPLCDLVADIVSDGCEPDDEAIRLRTQDAKRAGVDVIASVVVHFDEWALLTQLVRVPERKEMTRADEVETFSRYLADLQARSNPTMRSEGSRPQLETMRVGGVEVIRHTLRTETDAPADAGSPAPAKARHVFFNYFVFAEGNAYLLSLGTDSEHLIELADVADGVIHTLRARPAGRPGATTAYLTLRTVAQALMVAAVVVAVLVIVKRRRKPIATADLWPSREPRLPPPGP